MIEDAAYSMYQNNLDVKFFHELGKNKERTFTVFSGGKIFNMTGLRVGWAYGPVSHISTLKLRSDTSIPSCVD